MGRPPSGGALEAEGETADFSFGMSGAIVTTVHRILSNICVLQQRALSGRQSNVCGLQMKIK
jgi:hypothetical protein